MLTRLGYHVLTAGKPNHALSLSREHPGTIHLLLTDVVMPGMSGKELAERIASTRRDMKVLFTSGYTDDTIVHHGVLKPGIAFLEKPFTPSSLGGKVREVLD